MSTNKLAVGTVQFGLAYGIANQQGQVTETEVNSILDLASANGINTLDTAIAYGESEKVLGKMPLNGFEIITKLPSVPDDCRDVLGWVEQELEASFLRLNVSSLNGLLLHRPEQLTGNVGKQLYQALQQKKQEGIVKRIGISIYSPDELSGLADKFHFDLIQAPLNIIDRRLQESGWLKKLSLSGTQIHVRSVFMQGLLLMSSAARPEKFNRWSSLWATWDEWLKTTGLTPLQACLRHALAIPEVEKVVVGVDSSAQLNEILQAAKGRCTEPPAELACSDIKLLNPSLWSQL